jgi:hypothetical protein
MPKLKFTQKKGKGKRKAGDDSAAPKKRAKLAPEPSDVFDEVLGNQELLERIMLFVPTNGELGRIASVNKLFNTSSTSKTLWDARAKHYPTLTLDNTKLDKVKLYHRTGKFMKALLLLVRISSRSRTWINFSTLQRRMTTRTTRAMLGRSPGALMTSTGTP